MSEPSLQSLGRYTIHAELGRGGFATVYRATDTILERDVALKVLKPGWTDDAKAVERFMREARVASRLDHPGIVTIYDVGEAEGRLYIAMKLLPGQPLDRLIKSNGPLTWDRTLALMTQVTEALDYAHAQGLVHRDIKPANLIVGENDHAVLTDFGLVRGAEQASLSTGTTGGILGTPEYIPPEVWEGQPATKASDIYSLACVMYEMLFGSPLFAADTGAAVMRKHVLIGPEFPANWPPDVPNEVPEVLRRALAHEPSDRYATAGALASALREGADMQAAREQAAREQEARETHQKQEEAERAAQEAARKAEEERAKKEAEEGEKQQAAIAAQEKAKREAEDKARREAEEQERQRQVTIAAQEKAKREAEAAAAMTIDASSQLKESTPASASMTAPPASKSKTWAYVVGAVVVIAIIGVLIINGGNRSLPASAPVMPTDTIVIPEPQQKSLTPPPPPTTQVQPPTTQAPLPTTQVRPPATQAPPPTTRPPTHTPSPSPGTLLITSFEDLSVSSPDVITPFLFTREIPSANIFFYSVHPEFTNWKVDSRSRTGNLAINAIPNGNPDTDLATTATTAISSALLEIVFDVSGYDIVSLDFWVNSTSNPRIESIHNCDSSLSVYSKIDSGEWTHKTALCGQHKTESTGWHPVSLSFDVAGKSTIQFAFEYELQNNPTADPTVYYLVDDLAVTAK